MENGKHEKQQLEIERKFLIRYPDPNMLDKVCKKKITIIQTYLVPVKNISRRVRKQECGGETACWYNEKEKLSDMTRVEREREISETEYQDFLKEAIPDAGVIQKTRYLLPSGNHCFEVDVFPEWTDRAFAEVELESESQEFAIPECLELIREVTQDKRYTNLSLAVNGFIYEEI